MEGQWKLVPEQTLLRVGKALRELWIAAAGESGNGKVVGSAMP